MEAEKEEEKEEVCAGCTTGNHSKKDLTSKDKFNIFY